VSWLRRIGRDPSPAGPAPEAPVQERVERASPGLAALRDGLSADRSQAVLDLGPAPDSSLRVYSRFARWIRFADLYAATSSHDAWVAALDALPEQPDRPYDLVFAWNVLDRIAPEERDRLVKRLVEITSADARLYVIVDGSGDAAMHPFRFALVGLDRMTYEPTGAPPSAWPPLLPAEVERLLAPFHVERAFTSKVGLREYVAVRKKGRVR
jgi:hypothetical protein